MLRLARTILIGLAVCYGAIVLLLWALQERLLFPASIVAAAGPLPADAERLTATAVDGTALQGVYLPPKGNNRADTLILAFGGNATNAQFLAERLHRALPEYAIAALHSRGYPPSGGSPSAAAMIEDAATAFDAIAARYRPRRVVAVGVSLGSGIAATLAARRPLAGLILVTPFDSLRATAQQLYWWLPVSLLLRHDVDSIAALDGRDVPVAIIAAGADDLVRPERTDALRSALAQPRADIVLRGVGHSEIFDHPGFDDALRRAFDSLP